jgi:hypothetical protein
MAEFEKPIEIEWEYFKTNENEKQNGFYGCNHIICIYYSN